MPIKLPARIFAVVIGIDIYSKLSARSRLDGAVRDAEAFIQFLKDTFTEPEITALYNATATRENIIQAIYSLGENPNIRKDDAILIYFAGHGARVPKPSGPAWDSWISLDSKIEMLCPSDIGDSTTPNAVTGIPDRTIAALLNQLSGKKGDNITLILDCCHSVGINRDSVGDRKARHISNPPPISVECDHSIWSRGLNRAGTVSVGFLGQDSASHILLAACSRNELAWEDKGRGIFTRALLNVLNDVRCDSLDYATLVRKLENLSSYLPKGYNQTPVCDGINDNRILFQKNITSGDVYFISGQVDKQGSITMNAGEAQGIWKGALVEIYPSNDSQKEDNGSLATFVVADITATKSILSSQNFLPPRHFYAKVIQRHPKEIIRVYSTDTEIVRKMIGQALVDADPSVAGIIYDENEATADILVQFEQEKILYDRKEEIPGKSFRRLPFSTPRSRPDLFLHVLSSAARFNYHLRRVNESEYCILPQSIPMDIRGITLEWSREFERVIVPTGPNLLENSLATITVKGEEEDGRIYGTDGFVLTIHNDTNLLLHPYLFCFDVSTLSIEPWYLTPVGMDSDALLLPNSEFPVGYGDSGARPRCFSLLKGEESDVSFFKLFVTSRPTDFKFLSQKSPFEASEKRGSYKSNAETFLPDVWGTAVATVLQRI